LKAPSPAVDPQDVSINMPQAPIIIVFFISIENYIPFISVAKLHFSFKAKKIYSRKPRRDFPKMRPKMHLTVLGLSRKIFTMVRKFISEN
jgi:hypothetical protein